MTISEIVTEIQEEQIRMRERLESGWPASIDRVCYLVKELATHVSKLERPELTDL
jgi:TRAP-type mannitol/chloroaromatic compound transport system substrate-binding protein